MPEPFGDVPGAGAPPSMPPVPPPPNLPPLPPTPPPEPARQPKPRAQRRAPWMALLVLVLLGACGGSGYAIWRMTLVLRSLQGERSLLTREGRSVKDQMKELSQQREDLQREKQLLTADRDNLLAQNRRLTDERMQLAASAKLHEGVLKRVVRDSQESKARFDQLQQEHDQLQELADQWLRDRNRLKEELAQSQQSGQEGQLKELLVKERQAQKEQAIALRDYKKQLDQLEAQYTKVNGQVPKLQGRLEELQSKYAGLLSENKRIKHQANRMPEDVTVLAREHEGLLKEVADTHYNMGVMFAEGKDFQRAVREFQKVVELRPDDAESHYNLGVIYAEHLPDEGRATDHFRRYLQLNPDAHDSSWVKHYIASHQAWEAKERLE